MDAVTMSAPLYKYLAPQYAKGLVEEGSIKIGTLSEYRAMEGSDTERGDAYEGELVLQSPSGTNYYGGDRLPPILRHPAIKIGPGGLVTNGAGAITIRSTIADLYIYCTAAVHLADYCQRFGNVGPVACVRIDQTERFFLAMDRSLRFSLKAKGIDVSESRWGRCEYRDRQHNWEREDLPAAWLLKPARYSGQREVRVRWETNPIQPLQSLILKVPELCGCCTLLTDSQPE